MSDDYALAVRGADSRAWRLPLLRADDRTRYLIGAICLALCAIMLAPLVGM